MMRERVQVQKDYLAGLEMDRRDWHRHRTALVMACATSSKHKLLRRRLMFGGEAAGEEHET